MSHQHKKQKTADAEVSPDKLLSDEHVFKFAYLMFEEVKAESNRLRKISDDVHSTRCEFYKAEIAKLKQEKLESIAKEERALEKKKKTKRKLSEARTQLRIEQGLITPMKETLDKAFKTQEKPQE